MQISIVNSSSNVVRRGGFDHPVGSTTYEKSQFSAAQLVQFKADSHLTISTAAPSTVKTTKRVKED